MARILVVDDDAEVRALLSEVLAEIGHAITRARDGTDALIRMEAMTYDLILSDLTVPGVTGLGLYWEVVCGWPYLVSRLVYVTASVDSRSNDYRILLDDGIPILLKPFEPGYLLDVVAYVLQRRR